MKNLIFLLIAIYSYTSSAQSGSEQIKKIDGKNYIVYKVQQGDGWYGIARKYNITYAELRVANQNTDDKLFPGKEILIPADKLKINDPYFDKNHIDKETSAPRKTIDNKPAENRNSENRYHIVEASQTLFSISKMYNVGVDQIKAWNNLTSNSISKGQKIIVGKAEIFEAPSNETKEPEKKEMPIVPAVADVKPKPAVEIKPGEDTLTNEDSKEINQNDKDDKNLPATNEILAPPVNDQVGDKIIFSNGRKEVNENGTAVRMDDDDVNQDKYYAFHKTAPIGTIIRVLNLTNSRKIYVKITGQLTESFENSGIIIKLSKASAEKLGATDKSFQVNLLYGITPE